MPYVLSFFFLLGISFLAYIPNQSDFYLIFPVFTVLFFIYFLLLKKQSNKPSLRLLIGLAVLSRFSIIFAFPNLSDDIYRFIWDGQLISNSINPFSFLPSEIMTMTEIGFYPEQALFDALNSPSYYSVYPPISQIIFYISSLLSGGSWHVTNIFLKLFMVAAECGSIFLLLKILSHYKMDSRLSLIYALNPLIIIETCGNLHFEGIMVFFFLLFVWNYLQDKKGLSMVWLSFSIATKLLPLLILPFLLKKVGIKKFMKFAAIIGTILLVLFIPVFIGVKPANFLNSLDLYFRSFEFNGSIYYLLRYIGIQISGYNLIGWIGPILGLVTFFVIVIKAYKSKSDSLSSILRSFLWAFTVFLFLSTTIHPWYLILPICLSVFANSKYFLVWSYLIVMTYINYSYPTYSENLWIVTFEYAIVFLVFYFERRKNREGLKTLNNLS